MPSFFVSCSAINYRSQLKPQQDVSVSPTTSAMHAAAQLGRSSVSSRKRRGSTVTEAQCPKPPFAMDLSLPATNLEQQVAVLLQSGVNNTGLRAHQGNASRRGSLVGPRSRLGSIVLAPPDQSPTKGDRRSSLSLSMHAVCMSPGLSSASLWHM